MPVMTTAERTQVHRSIPAPPRRATITTLLPTDQTGGRRQTIGDYIVAQIESGVHPLTAAATAGVLQAEYMTWLREGQLVIAKLNGGAAWETDFTPDQQDQAVFAERAVRAHANQIARLSRKSEEIAMGGIEIRSTRTKRDEKGTTLEVVETVEHTLPDSSMVQWRLRHLEPSVFGDKATLNITVQDLTDTTVVKERVVEMMTQIVDRLRPKAIETTATEVVDGPLA